TEYDFLRRPTTHKSPCCCMTFRMTSRASQVSATPSASCYHRSTAPQGDDTVSKQSDNTSREKVHCLDYLERNAKAIATLNDSIFYFGELGMQEFETSKLMTELLETAGFKVERGISGFPTGFCATHGS